MPLYYFDVRDDQSFVPDDTGLEFDSLKRLRLRRRVLWWT